MVVNLFQPNSWSIFYFDEPTLTKIRYGPWGRAELFLFDFFVSPFIIQRENSSVITLRRYTFSIGNNTGIVVA